MVVFFPFSESAATDFAIYNYQSSFEPLRTAGYTFSAVADIGATLLSNERIFSWLDEVLFLH